MATSPARLAAAACALAATLALPGCQDPLVEGDVALDGTYDVPAVEVPGAPGVPLIPFRLIDSTALDGYRDDRLAVTSMALRSLSVWTLAAAAPAIEDGGAAPPCSTDPVALSSLQQAALVLRPLGGGSGEEVASATFASSLAGCDTGCCRLDFAPGEAADLVVYPEPWALWLDAIGKAPSLPTLLAGRITFHLSGHLRAP